MPTRQHQKPPPGFIFIEDSTDERGEELPGIASRLGISVSTYRKWRMAGNGPTTVRHGKRVLARISAVDEYMNRLAPVTPVNADESRPAEPRRRAA